MVELFVGISPNSYKFQQSLTKGIVRFAAWLFTILGIEKYSC